MSYARECLTWDAKAQSTTRVLNWAVGAGSETRPPAAKGVAPGACELILRWSTLEILHRRDLRL